MSEKIATWAAYFAATFREDPTSGHLLWLHEDFRPQMTGKFRRIHDRLQRRVEREMTPYAYAVHGSRRIVEVTARKHRARKGGKK